jgi:hypothetical protein
MEATHGVSNWKSFVKAGQAIFTVENTESKNRYTFRVTKCKRYKEKEEGENLWFVSVLSGPNNKTNYTYIGSLFNSEFRHTRNSRVGKDAKSFKVFFWLNIFLQSERELPENVKVYHEGFCGRCGRALTVPESIECGYGPECLLLI